MCHDSSPARSDASASPGESTSNGQPDLNLVRTDLANERTLLAYGRTGLMVSGTGVTLIKFFADLDVLWLLGWAFVVLGLAVGFAGIARFASLHARLHRHD
ncbi:DUF202 domain-containing protein [Novipirellula artificiosorum]|uniref:DUF202 domain-containing protein n=1 Tax=Novipirellula artificiosorum TaxID=2528016 RepID=A0A5C6DG75_9BACT|nr:DUF202 domain-containing protein [Novipirellula artificiosorum]TWU34984.1 hypothetical protein Poly41_41280 [Novipirellula artificiosorum]